MKALDALAERVGEDDLGEGGKDGKEEEGEEGNKGKDWRGERGGRARRHDNGKRWDGTSKKPLEQLTNRPSACKPTETN